MWCPRCGGESVECWDYAAGLWYCYDCNSRIWEEELRQLYDDLHSDELEDDEEYEKKEEEVE